MEKRKYSKTGKYKKDKYSVLKRLENSLTKGSLELENEINYLSKRLILLSKQMDMINENLKTCRELMSNG